MDLKAVSCLFVKCTHLHILSHVDITKTLNNLSAFLFLNSLEHMVVHVYNIIKTIWTQNSIHLKYNIFNYIFQTNIPNILNYPIVETKLSFVHMYVCPFVGICCNPFPPDFFTVLNKNVVPIKIFFKKKIWILPLFFTKNNSSGNYLQLFQMLNLPQLI